MSDITIPGRTEVVLPLEMNALRNSDGRSNSAFLLEESSQFADKYNLKLANCLVQPQNNVIPARIVNCLNTDVKLYANTTVGDVTALEKASVFPLEVTTT